MSNDIGPIDHPDQGQCRADDRTADIGILKFFKGVHILDALVSGTVATDGSVIGTCDRKRFPSTGCQPAIDQFLDYLGVGTSTHGE